MFSNLGVDACVGHNALTRILVIFMPSHAYFLSFICTHNAYLFYLFAMQQIARGGRVFEGRCATVGHGEEASATLSVSYWCATFYQGGTPPGASLSQYHCSRQVHGLRHLVWDGVPGSEIASAL